MLFSVLLLGLALTGFVDCQRECDKETEIQVECENLCLATCQKPVSSRCLYSECKEGCDCRSGYIRLKVDGPCIRAGECERWCGENQEFQKCGSACPSSCQQPVVRICGKKCVTGCFCKEGFTFDESTNECVEKCPYPIRGR